MEVLSKQKKHAIAKRHVRDRLESMGYFVAEWPYNLAMVDFAIAGPDGSHYGVKVSVNSNGSKKWRRHAYQERITGESLFYCLVSADEPMSEESLKMYVVPAPVVARHIAVRHAEWLATPGRNGQQHNDQPTRFVEDPVTGGRPGTEAQYPDGWLDDYEEAWSIIGTRTARFLQ